jgi:hypothetical protein
LLLTTSKYNKKCAKLKVSGKVQKIAKAEREHFGPV